MKLELHLGHGGLTDSRGDGADAPVLDRHVFDELLATLGNDAARVRNVYRKFVDSTAERLEEVRHQSAADSAATFHALKGSAGMVGANRLATVAARLQLAAPWLDNETRMAGIGELERELAAFRQVLGEQMRPFAPDP